MDRVGGAEKNLPLRAIMATRGKTKLSISNAQVRYSKYPPYDANLLQTV